MTNDSRVDVMLALRADGATLADIGGMFQITRERVRQIIGTEHKGARIGMLVADANRMILENPEITWEGIESALGTSRNTLIRYGVVKDSTLSLAAAGRAKTKWPISKCIDAAIRWEQTHGRLPKSSDWHNASNDHPVFTTIYRKFGNWNNFCIAAKEKMDNETPNI